MQITQPLHRALQQYPDRIAMRFGDRETTFRTFADRVARLAGALRELGMGTGDRVAMLALNCDRYLEYVIGVPWGGGVINPCNTRWSRAEVGYSLEDSGSTILLTDDAFLDDAVALRDTYSAVQTVIHFGDRARPEGVLDYEALIAAANPIADAQRSGDDLLGLFYTGGTTGASKGVMLSHANVFTSSLAMVGEEGAPRGSVYLHAAPMFHLADLWLGFTHWLQGNAHVFLPAFTPAALIEAIDRYQASHVVLVPTMIQMLVDDPEIIAGRRLPSLRGINYGASPISEAVLSRAIERLPGVGFFQAYGMTELGPLATVLTPWYHTPEGVAAGKLRSAGRASYCSEIAIVDPEGHRLPNGSVGEIIVRGPGVMLGYWNQPELTAQTVVDGWMHTGDGGYMDDDGYIYVVDRIKDMVISGGENIYSIEVEGAIARHPAVAANAVIGIPSEKWGETVHAVVVLNDGHSLTEAELMEFCNTLIAGYKCPRSVAFTDALPLSGAGKVLKTELRKPFWTERARGIS